MKDDRKRRNALARMAAGSRPEEEAQRLGKSKRTLQRWKAASDVVKTDVSPDVTPLGETPGDSPEKKPNPALEAALKGAGEAPAGPRPLTEGEIAQAQVDKAEFCVSTINGMRMAAGVQAVKFVFSPPLNATSPEVLALCKLDPFTEMAVRAQADRLYGPLVGFAANPYVLYIALGVSTVGMFIGISKLAEARGWEPKKKAERAPTPADFAAQLKPKPAEPPPEAPPTPASMKGSETIVDAPLPPPPEEPS